jgi:hypothetical protein
MSKKKMSKKKWYRSLSQYHFSYLLLPRKRSFTYAANFQVQKFQSKLGESGAGTIPDSAELYAVTSGFWKIPKKKASFTICCSAITCSRKIVEAGSVAD